MRAIAAKLGCDDAGQPLKPLGDRWLADLATLARLQDNEQGGVEELWQTVRGNLGS